MTMAQVVLLSVLAVGLAVAQPAYDVEDLVVLAQPAPPPPPPAPPEPLEAPLPARAYLGIGVAEINAERAKALKLSEERGVEITRVEPDSPAEKAGLKPGDVVLEYNGQRVEGTQQFVRMVRETPPGRRVTLLISRDGATQTVAATLGRRRAADWSLGPEFRADMERLREQLRDLRIEVDAPRAFILSWRSALLGVEAESLTDQLAEFFGVKEGVLVRSVLKGTPAEKAGLKAGDVITKVEGETVRSPSQISSRLRRLRDKGSAQLTIVRNRQEMTVTIALEPERGRGREDRPRPRTISVEPKVRL